MAYQPKCLLDVLLGTNGKPATRAACPPSCIRCPHSLRPVLATPFFFVCTCPPPPTGSLLSYRTVLTAAHCFTGGTSIPINAVGDEVRVGGRGIMEGFISMVRVASRSHRLMWAVCRSRCSASDLTHWSALGALCRRPYFAVSVALVALVGGKPMT